MNGGQARILPRYRDDRLTFVSLRHADGTRLCLLGPNGSFLPVGHVGDVAELLAETGAHTLEEAVEVAGTGDPFEPSPDAGFGPPARPAEVWAAGVTYERSRDARMYEAQGHQSAYDKVYDADRPELFLKSTATRLRGPGETIGLRSDSLWQVPEPELGLVLGAGGRVLGYLLGNDMSCRDIEGDNALYLPQAKIYNGSCALGPAVVSACGVAYEDITVGLRVHRDTQLVVDDAVDARRLKRPPSELATWLVRDNDVAAGTVLLTGTGIVPDDDFSLQPDDEVEICSEPLGRLINRCAPAAAL
jgi:2-dehydro-3-deoxy-D-arabinonate dehydratase